MATGFGHPSGSHPLDLINTVDWRDDPARRLELVPTAQALSRWARHVGVPAALARGVRHESQRRRAVRLRETLASLFQARAERRPLPAGASAALTRWTREAWRHRELADHRGTPAWRWQSRIDAVDRILFDLVLEAGTLLLSPDADRIRICAGAGCGWFFLDRSKAGRRRWCSMAACGNRVKVRQYRRKQVARA
jgi:predicted RNA-binding Zn ribbon-like protein